MPFFYDETSIEWPEDGSDLPPPRADQFFYMTAAEYRGESTSARFSILPFSTPVEHGQPPQPAQAESRGILNRWFGWTSPAVRQQERQEQQVESMRRAYLSQQQRTQQLFAIMVPALRTLGVRRAYCRYDGGHDEGFSWLDRYETQGGDRIEADALVKQLYEMGTFEKLHAAGFKDHMRGVSAGQKMADIQMFACSRLIDDWAFVLLGSYGAGEYSMYGAFTVDLDECSVTDDSSASPIVKNIEIAE